jgi:hypothetical protein
VLSMINKVQCPYSRYQNMRCLDKRIVSMDLYQHGFVPHYEVWRFHGELVSQAMEEEEDDYNTRVDRMDEMLKAIQP